MAETTEPDVACPRHVGFMLSDRCARCEARICSQCDPGPSRGECWCELCYQEAPRGPAGRWLDLLALAVIVHALAVMAHVFAFMRGWPAQVEPGDLALSGVALAGWSLVLVSGLMFLRRRRATRLAWSAAVVFSALETHLFGAALWVQLAVALYAIGWIAFMRSPLARATFIYPGTIFPGRPNRR